MTLRHWIAVLSAAVALFAPVLVVAQDAPVPAPLPSFRQAEPAVAANVTAEDVSASLFPTAAAPTTRTVTTTTIIPADVAATANDAVAAVAADPQPVTLAAQLTENSGNLEQGVMWRVFETKTDSTGQPALAAKSDEAVANLSLAPGQYVVHVAYGRAQASQLLTVEKGQNSTTIAIEAGALRLNAAVTGDVPIPINLLHFDVFASGTGSDTDSSRVQVAQNVSANDILTLNAGTYHIVSYFGDVNAIVRADLRVEPNQLTDATIYHRAAQVSFKLVTKTGGEAVADVDWTVKTADGTTVFTNIGAFPSTVLKEGDYLVLAKQADKVFNREFQVQPGQAREIEVLTTVY